MKHGFLSFILVLVIAVFFVSFIGCVSSTSREPLAPIPKETPATMTQNQTSSSLTSLPLPTTSPTPTLSSWPSNWSSFLPSLVATFIGALLGFLFALEVERRVRKRAESKEIRQRRERHIMVLQVLVDEISRNEGRLNQMKSELRASLVLDYSVVLDVWQATKTEVLEAIRDSKAAEAITQLYNYLDLIAGALAVYNRLALAGGSDLAVARTDRLPRLENLIDEATDAATRATQAMSSEIQRLKAEK